MVGWDTPAVWTVYALNDAKELREQSYALVDPTVRLDSHKQLVAVQLREPAQPIAQQELFCHKGPKGLQR